MLSSHIHGFFEISHQDKNKKDVLTNKNKYSGCFMNMDSNDKKETSKASQDFLSLIIQFCSKVSQCLENSRFKCCRLSKGKMSATILFAIKHRFYGANQVYGFTIMVLHVYRISLTRRAPSFHTDRFL